MNTQSEIISRKCWFFFSFPSPHCSVSRRYGYGSYTNIQIAILSFTVWAPLLYQRVSLASFKYSFSRMGNCCLKHNTNMQHTCFKHIRWQQHCYICSKVAFVLKENGIRHWIWEDMPEKCGPNFIRVRMSEIKLWTRVRTCSFAAVPT